MRERFMEEPTGTSGGGMTAQSILSPMSSPPKKYSCDAA